MGYYDTASPTSTALARDNQKKDDLIFGIIGIFVVAWLGLILGQCIGPGFDLSEIGNKLGPALSHPFRIRFTPIALTKDALDSVAGRGLLIVKTSSDLDTFTFEKRRPVPGEAPCERP